MDYTLTRPDKDLKPLVLGLGVWGQRWVEARTTLNNLDPSLLCGTCVATSIQRPCRRAAR